MAISAVVGYFLTAFLFSEKEQTSPISMTENEESVSSFNTNEIFIYEKNNLPEHLETVYAMLKNGEFNQGNMKELTPINVFFLFLYAEEQADYEVQYALFNHDRIEERPYASYEEYEQASVEDQHINPFEAFENQQIMQVIMDESSAYITTVENQNVSFWLNKSAEEIWTANWLPLQ